MDLPKHWKEAVAHYGKKIKFVSHPLTQLYSYHLDVSLLLPWEVRNRLQLIVKVNEKKSAS
jgi:hypothetical protein